MPENVGESMVKRPFAFGVLTKLEKCFKKIHRQGLIVQPIIIVSLIIVLAMIITAFGTDVSGDEILMDFSSRELFDYYVFNAMNAIGIFLVGAVFYTIVHLTVAKLIKSPALFGDLISLNLYLVIIQAIGVLINSILFLIFKVDINFTNVGFLFEAESMLAAVVSMFDLFGIFHLIAMVIGLRVIGEFSRKAAISVGLIFFFTFLLFDVLVTFM